MVLSWCCHGAVMVLSWCCHGAVMVLPYCHGVAMMLSWCNGAAMVLSWCCHGAVMVLPWCSHGDLRHIRVSPRINSMQPTVTDSMLCCLWPKVIDCIYDGGLTKCYGIMTNMASRIAFIALTILAATTVLSV